MAISSPASYLPTMDEFIAHWTLVNAALSPNPLVLGGGVGLDELVEMRADLLGRREVLQIRINTRQLATEEVKTARSALLVRFSQLTSRIGALAPGSKWTRALPLAPSPGAGISIFLDAMLDAAHVWQLYNAEATPFELPGDLDQAAFVLEVQALDTKSKAVSQAVTGESLARDQRKELEGQVRNVLRDYRQAVPSFLMPGDPLIESLPRLTPLKGHTPEPVAAEGEWVPAETKGKIVWEASEEATLKHYQVRWAPGTEAADYSTEDEEVLGTVLPGAAREFLTTKGLLLAGGVSLFRVYVVLTTDNEKGSETVVITRPE